MGIFRDTMVIPVFSYCVMKPEIYSLTRGAWAATGYSSLSVCYPRRAWAATGIVVCWFVTRGRRGQRV